MTPTCPICKGLPVPWKSCLHFLLEELKQYHVYSEIGHFLFCTDADSLGLIWVPLLCQVSIISCQSSLSTSQSARCYNLPRPSHWHHQDDKPPQCSFAKWRKKTAFLSFGLHIRMHCESLFLDQCFTEVSDFFAYNCFNFHGTQI